MAIKFSMYNYTVFVSALSPLIISAYLLLNSFFQGNLRGIVFLLGSMISSLLGNLAKKSLNEKRGPFKKGDSFNPSTDMPAHDFCDIFEPINPELKYLGSPSSHAVFFGYLLSYLGLGIVSNESSKPGIPFWSLLTLLMTLDLGFRFKSGCDGGKAIGIGLFIGMLCGLAWFYAVLFGMGFMSGGKLDGGTLVYNYKDDVHNPDKCVLGKTKYKCTYKKI